MEYDSIKVEGKEIRKKGTITALTRVLRHCIFSVLKNRWTKQQNYNKNTEMMFPLFL